MDLKAHIHQHYPQEWVCNTRKDPSKRKQEETNDRKHCEDSRQRYVKFVVVS